MCALRLPAMNKHLARANRRRLSDAEVRLWVNLSPLRQQGLAFRRQSPVGRYILDFECRRAKLCIECDGGQHGMIDARAYDAERDAWLTAQGYLVLRYTNHDVLTRTDLIVEEIVRIAKQRVAERSK